MYDSILGFIYSADSYVGLGYVLDLRGIIICIVGGKHENSVSNRSVNRIGHTVGLCGHKPPVET